MPTLWDIWFKKEEKADPLELSFFNPYKLRVGNHIRIDTLEHETNRFTLRQLREFRREIGGQTFVHGDYELAYKPLDGPEIKVLVRMVPKGDNPQEHDCILLELLDEFGWNDECKPFEEGLNTNLEFQEGDSLYYRVNDVQAPYNAKVALVRDEDADGTVEEEEIRRHNVQYWDFWAEFEEEGVKVLEFYIVEKDQDEGWFQIWRGRYIDPQRIHVD